MILLAEECRACCVLVVVAELARVNSFWMGLGMVKTVGAADEVESERLCSLAWRGRCEAEVMLRASGGREGATWSESDVEFEIRRYGVVKLSRRPLESPKGLSGWDTADQGGEVGGGVVVVGLDLVVVVVAWVLTGGMAMPAKSLGLLCRAATRAIVT